MFTELAAIDPLALTLAVLGIVLGGLVKGATGAGAPVVAVPMLALAFDVPTAVTIFAIPNLFSNIWQSWSFRAHHLPRGFTMPFVIAAIAGAALGTVMLVSLPPQALMVGTACVCIAFIAFRMARPGWVLPLAAATRVTLPVGVVAGVLQGAIGVSAPVSVTFLSAMKLDRPVFIATISAIFVAMSLVQLPMMAGLGLMTPMRVAFGLGTLAILLATMPIGSALARRWSPKVFNTTILIMLAVIAARLLYDAATH